MISSSPARRLGPEDFAIFETFVVPRYLSMFSERMLEMLVTGSDARVCHVHCRTGFPDRTLLEKLPGAHVFGCDASEHAIELARAKASMLTRKNPGSAFDYRVVDSLPLPFLLAEVGEPGCVKLLGRFLQHADADAVAAAIEALAELGDPAAIPLLAPVEKDTRHVQIDEEDGGERVAIGDLAHEAREILTEMHEKHEPAPKHANAGQKKGPKR